MSPRRPARPDTAPSDDSVTLPEPGDPEKIGKPGRPRGEDDRKKGPEPGRHDGPEQGPSERPTGGSTGRDSTGIDPQDPIDPDSPNLR